MMDGHERQADAQAGNSARKKSSPDKRAIEEKLREIKNLRIAFARY
jgi:hypothetical protein